MCVWCCQSPRLPRRVTLGVSVGEWSQHSIVSVVRSARKFASELPKPLVVCPKVQFNIILCDDYDDETELLSSDDNRGICLRVNILMN